MSFHLLLAFIAACVLLAVTPGPNMALIIANTASQGLRAGLLTMAGTSTGLIFLVTIAALGMTSIMLFMSEWFDVLRWVGACYLAWLGLYQLKAWYQGRRAEQDEPLALASAGRWYAQGMGVSLSNPKVLLFLGAFFPQFMDPAGDPVSQLWVLSVLFVVVLVAADIACTLAVARARTAFATTRLRMLDGISGVLLLLGGAALAMTRRP